MKKFLLLQKIKNTVPWKYTINDLNGEKIVGRYYEKELQKTNQKELKGNEISYMSNGKTMIILFIAGLIKKILQNEGALS